MGDISGITTSASRNSFSFTLWLDDVMSQGQKQTVMTVTVTAVDGLQGSSRNQCDSLVFRLASAATCLQQDTRTELLLW